MSAGPRSFACMDAAARGDPARAWRELRDLAAAQARYLTGPRPGLAGLCASCCGPAGTGRVRCYQCDLHWQCAPGSLADLVVPVAYAAKGGPHAQNLWRYKSGRDGQGRDGAGPDWVGPDWVGRDSVGRETSAAAGAALRALLLVFLREHGHCLWRGAPGGRPSHLAVVPSGRGRSGTHPLRGLLGGSLTLPWAGLTNRPAARHPVRELDPERFAAPRLPGARVLLLDDTWTSGASAQSAAMALRLAGARWVAVVVLGRHLSEAGPPGAACVAPPGLAFRLDQCAVHHDQPHRDR